VTDERDPIGPQRTVEEIKEFWREFGKNLVQGSILAVEESAKQVVNVNGVLIGFYSGTIVLSEMRNQNPPVWQLVLFLSPILFWLLSLMTALSIFWTGRFKINLESSVSAKKVIENMLQRKHNSLKFSFIFLFSGILLLLMSLAVYLYI
jgi:ethanolamine utilization microcompartment shell protein EutS